ncbi:hypothetical protein BBJ28_00019532 [Nothophytophthora sp. Chile5]|nr:hypothetical protein BBJ28_00019532 [Nothophytophthora sp. Chile5]
MAPSVFGLLLCIMAAAVAAEYAAATPHYAPNHFLGTCLTDAWVVSMEKDLNVSATARDPATKTLLHPFLHAALQYARYAVSLPAADVTGWRMAWEFNVYVAWYPQLVDSRTENVSAYNASCMPSADVIYGHGAVVDESTGAVLDIGQTAGSLVVEMHDWSSHRLTALVFAIVAAEVVRAVRLGYNVSTYYTTDFVALSGRLKLNDPQSLCTPTHVDLAAPAELSFGTYDWLAIGSVGHSKVSGIWTTTDLITDGTNASKYATPFYADFWRDYTTNDDLISANAVSNLRNNSKYFPPRGMFCFDGLFGCLNQCSKSYACTLREGEGKECLVVAIADFKDVYGYWPSFLSNLGFPAYFCFIGRSGLEEYIVDMQQSGRGVLFYMNQPDDFFSRHPASFQRISLPKTSAEKVLLNTWQFGENGYGQPNNNPIAVEYPEDVQQKVCSLIVAAVSANDPVMALLERFRVLELSMSQLLANYAAVIADASSVPADPFFESACTWVKGNYDVWRRWIDPLPECTVIDHMTYTVTGCNGSSHRDVSFQWRLPDPDNSSLPFECDGGFLELPVPMQSSRSCDWLAANEDEWSKWVRTLPTCDSDFHTYEALECERTGDRHIIFRWLLPDPTNASLSLECSGAVLPDPIIVACDYVPVQSIGFVIVFVIVMIVLAGIVTCMVLVFKNRNIPIIRRSQFEFLETMLAGTILMCCAALIYAGRPTDGLCVARPVVLAIGLTLIFGSLTVNALLMFWKAILLGAGLYLSFLIRNVSVDFQESIWMFASSLVVVFGCVMILPLAYMIVLPATTFYYFFSTTLWLCTSVVVALMLVPKMLRQKENATTMTNGSTMVNNKSSVGGDESTAHSRRGTSSDAQLVAKKVATRPETYRVTPSNGRVP